MYRGINLQGNTASSRVPLSHFANFSPNLSYYFPQMGRPTLRYLPFDRNYFRTPDVKSKFKSTYVADKTLDYTEKELLDESETMRGPRERDFYQDHSYFDQWIERDLNKDQSEQLMKVYGWMVPGYEVKPWIWHPGDTVEVVKGPFAGQRGTILNIVKYKNECFVQNVNVQPIVVPASESRPEQTILREHPIDVRLVKLVDPQSNEPCDVKLVTVRDKETGQKIERRMSLATGVLLPLPKPSNNDSVETGDPMYDTPLEDAEEPTYFPDQELPVMTARKLRAMEDHFVESLKEAHVHHEKYREDNVKHLRLYQQQVVKSSARYVLSTVFRGKLRLSASQRAMWAEATADIELPRKQTDAGDDEPIAAADNADEEEAASVAQEAK